jgi:hypothetical protein
MNRTNTSTLDLLEHFVATCPTFPDAIGAMEDALRDARVCKAEATSDREARVFYQQERTFSAILALIQKPDKK